MKASIMLRDYVEQRTEVKQYALALLAASDATDELPVLDHDSRNA
jgi:hypothetical protein